MTRPTPTALRAITLTITDPQVRDDLADPIGSCAVRLVLPLRSLDDGLAAYDLTAWAVTHALGSPAGGTHTEVAFVDGTLASVVPTALGVERFADDLVRQVANLLYARSWAFHYRPERVAESVLRHGSLLRERVEVSGIEVYS